MLVQIAAASIAMGLGLVLLIAIFTRRLALAFDTLAGAGLSHVRAFCIARVLPFAPRPPPLHSSLAFNSATLPRRLAQAALFRCFRCVDDRARARVLGCRPPADGLEGNGHWTESW